jgi:hypothetical protein
MKSLSERPRPLLNARTREGWIVVITCLRCGLDFVTKKPARGPVATICSRRRCRRPKAPKEPSFTKCLVCPEEFPSQDSGRPRLFCTLDCQEVARWDREWQMSFISERTWMRLDAVGYLPGSWHREAPPKKAKYSARGDGSGELPLSEWSAWAEKDPEGHKVFVDEFGVRGAAVGQTYRYTGLTLGESA